MSPAEEFYGYIGCILGIILGPHQGHIRAILGLYYIGLYWGYIEAILGLEWGYIKVRLRLH